jgi:type IV pilus assembly protein PilM
VPEPNSAYDPEKIDRHLWVMAVKELFRQQGLNPKKVKSLVTGINGSSASIKQITTLEMVSEELESAMTFEARKHIPMDGTDAVIDYQIFGSNQREVDKIDIGLVACTKGVLNSHIDLIKECGLRPGVVDVNPIALSNAFTFIKNMPDDGLVVILDIGAVSSTLVVYGKGQQYFTRDLPLGGHHFVKELSDKKEISYTEAQDLLFKEGLSAAVSNAFMEPSDRVGIAERTVYDNLVEDLRRSLRFYAKQTGQSFFLKVFLSGGAADTAGLTDFISSKLNIECGIFDPFFEVDGAENISVNNPSQYTTALGLGLRGGMAHD